jgi:hypothetical protein
MSTTASRLTCGAGLALLLAALPAGAVSVGPFGPHGEGGSRNGQMFTVGPGGGVYELDALVHVDGQDLNGADPGTSARLSRDALPAELAYAFTNVLAADASHVVLRYRLENTGAADLNGVRFFCFLDGEIDEQRNTFFNEYGTADGTAGHGSGDRWADWWQIDEPGFLQGQVMANLLGGTLSNSNAIPATAPDDVSMALGFDLGRIRSGEQITINVMVSENGASTGTLALVHHDLDPASPTVITLSGAADRVYRELTNLVVTGGSILLEGGTQTNTCTAYFSDGTHEDVSGVAAWSLVGTAPPGTTVAGSVLHAGDVTASAVVTVEGRYAYRGVERAARLDVRIESADRPVDVTAQVALSFAWQLNRSTGALDGTVQIRNTGNVGLADAFQLAIKASPDFFFAAPSGTMTDGDTYLDLTSQMEAAALLTGNRDRVLDPGESVVVRPISVYSRQRLNPADALFELWAKLAGVNGPQGR